MQDAVPKLEAHVETLLDLLLDVTAKWAVLKPLVSDRQLLASFRTGHSRRGLDIIRRTLMQSCVQDIAHIALDPTKKAPSIAKVILALNKASTVTLLRDRYLGLWAGTRPTMPDFAGRRAEGEGRFDGALQLARARWSQLNSSKALKAFKTLRDKNLAHVEVMFEGGKYRRLDVKALGITWKDIGDILQPLEEVVLALNTVCRSAWIDMNDVRTQSQQTSVALWEAMRVA